MAAKPFKKLTAQQQWDRDRPRIHALKNQVMKDRPGFEEENYRDIILDVSQGKTDSSRNLTARERWQLIERLEELVSPGSRVPVHESRNRPNNMEVPDRAELLGKIEACLTERKLPWSYAESMARRICKKNALEFCGPRDLWKIVAAFGYDAKRKGLQP